MGVSSLKQGLHEQIRDVELSEDGKETAQSVQGRDVGDGRNDLVDKM